MNQTNYKKIAEIIKKNCSNPLTAKDLADYFEEEGEWEYDKFNNKIPLFNKKQFLKDCGVDTDE